MRQLAVALLLSAVCGPSFAAQQSTCAALTDDKARLACYDDVFNRKRDRGASYRPIDVIDLKAEGDSIAGAKVEVEGFGWFVENWLDVASEPTGKITVTVGIDSLDKAMKRRLISDCNSPFDRTSCKLKIDGRVLHSNSDPHRLRADTVGFLPPP